MTQTPYVPPVGQEPPPAAPPVRPPLRRRRDDRVLGGVCSGLARYLGVDPVLVRVIVVILALFGGGGVLIYIAAWLLIPEEGRTQSAAQQLVGAGDSQTALIVIIAVVVGLAIALPMSGMWFGMGPDFGAPAVLLLIGAVALVVWLIRREEQPPSPPASPTPTSPEVTAMTDPNWQSTAVLPPPPVEPTPPAPPVPSVPPAPPTPKSVLGLLTVSAAALVAGGLITVGLAVSDSAINATTVFGAALAVVGVGLLLGTYIGRSRGLIVLGVVLSLATAASAAASSVDLAGGVGDRTWRPTSAANIADEYQLGIGEATLDLRTLEVPPAGLDSPIVASVGVGELTVYVPPDVDVQLDASVGLGQINIAGRPSVDGSNTDVTTLIDVPDATTIVTLDVEVGIGEITVRPSPVGSSLFQQGALR